MRSATEDLLHLIFVPMTEPSGAYRLFAPKAQDNVRLEKHELNQVKGEKMKKLKNGLLFLTIALMPFAHISVANSTNIEGRFIKHTWQMSKPAFERGDPWVQVDSSFRMIAPVNHPNFPLLSSKPMSTIIFGHLKEEDIKKVYLNSLKRGFFYSKSFTDPDNRSFERFDFALLRYDELIGNYYNDLKSLDKFALADEKQNIVDKLLEYHKKCRKEVKMFYDNTFTIKSPQEGKLTAENYDMEKKVLKIPVLRFGPYDQFGIDYLAYRCTGKNASKLLTNKNVTYSMTFVGRPKKYYCKMRYFYVPYDLLSMKVKIKQDKKVVMILDYNSFRRTSSYAHPVMGVRYQTIKSMFRESEQGWPEKFKGQKITNSIGMEFIHIPSREFSMDIKVSKNNKPIKVIVDSFFIQNTRVTLGQWRAIMQDIKPDEYSWRGRDDEYLHNPELPVTDAGWKNANEFVHRLNMKEQTDRYRLPSEAEWEAACRADSSGQFDFGKAWEWTWDFEDYGSDYYNRTPLKNPQGPNSADAYCFIKRSRRTWGREGSKNTAGFRVVLDVSDINNLAQTPK